MPARRITLVLEGRAGPGLHVRATDFLREVQLLLTALTEPEREIHPSGETTLDYEIVDLRTESPATVVLEAQPLDPTYDLSEEVVAGFFSVVLQVRNGQSLPKRIAYRVLQNVASMAAPVGETLTKVTISTDEQSLGLTRELRSRIEEVLAPEETYPGFIRGMLEAINVHKNANVFRIYPDIGPSKVTCHFPSELENDAIRAVGHFVEIRGTLKYKTNSPYPHEVSVERIEAFPNESELPTFGELRGIAPKATGSALSEEFIRKLRDAAD